MREKKRGATTPTPLTSARNPSPRRCVCVCAGVCLESEPSGYVVECVRVGVRPLD